jgi:tetratricopeptide (TPR) repeat protein
MKILWVCAALLWPALLRADDSAPPLSPLTAKAISEFQAGQKSAACVDATAALAANAMDEKAMGISKLTCGAKAIDNMDIKAIKQAPDKEDKSDLKPKPFSGKSNGPQKQPQDPQPQPGVSKEGLVTGGMPAENNAAQVISAAPTGPGIQDQATPYDKTMEAQSLLAQGKPGEAVDAARAAIALQPNRRAYDALAEATRTLHDNEQLLAVSEQGLKSFPNDLDLLRNKVFALNKKQDYAAAIAAADQALALYATDATLMALKAYALGRSGDHDGMVKALETAFALDPSFEPLLMDARSSKGGEPFLMPGDSKEEPRKGIPAPRMSGSMARFLIFGGLIALLVIVALLAVTGVFKRGEAETPAGPEEAAAPPASPPADPPASPPAGPAAS